MNQAAVTASIGLVAAVTFLVACAADVTLRRPQTGRTAVCKGGYYQHGLIYRL